jgi:tryptophan-rich sensory protein
MMYRVMFMVQKPWKNVLVWVIISELVGVVAGLLTQNATEIYGQMALKAPLSPPGWLFPAVWSILYALMGIGAGIVFFQMPDQDRNRGLNLMVGQLVVNFFWPLLFFNAQAYGIALLWLILLLVLVIWMTLEFRKISPLAALLQIPYIIWLIFATYLNVAVWYLNR